MKFLIGVCIAVFALSTVFAIGQAHVDDEEVQLSPEVNAEDALLSPPQNLVVDSKNSSTSLFVSWDPPVNGTQYILWYIIEWDGTPSGSNLINYDNDTFYVIEGLYPCSIYFVTVTAHSRDHGDSSSQSDGSTEKDVPGEPTDVVCSVLSSTSINVTWEKSNVNQCVVKTYEVYANGNSLWSDMNDSISQNNSENRLYTTLEGLIPYALYQISVDDLNDLGRSNFATCNGTTEQAPPGPPTNVSSTATDSSAVNVTWLPPEEINGILTGYWLKVSSESMLITEFNTGSADPYYLLSDLDLCTDYDIIVVGETGGGNGTPSEPGKAFLEGAATYEPMCKSTSDNEILVNWNITNAACASGNISTNVSWEIVIKWIEGPDSIIKNSTVTTDTSFSGIEFFYYSSYTICFSDNNNVQNTDCCSLDTPEGAPSMPQDLECTESYDTQISLKWSPPIELNGVIDHYTVEWIDNAEDISGDQTTFTASGLVAETPYEFRVSASTIEKGPAAIITANTSTETMSNNSTPETTFSFVTIVLTTTNKGENSSKPRGIVVSIIGGILLLRNMYLN